VIANKEKLRLFLDAKNLSEQDFTKLLDVHKSEVDKLVNGERVGYDTARKFIYFFKGELAQHYINWEATGVANPLSTDTKNKIVRSV